MIVVVGFVGLAILEIGGVQSLSAPGVIVETLIPEPFEIEKVADVFLDRPFVVVTFGEGLRGKTFDGGSEAIGRAAKAFENFRSGIGRETELESAREPASVRAHYARTLTEKLRIKN